LTARSATTAAFSSYRRTNELLESSLIDLLPLVDIDRAPHVAVEAGIKQFLRILEGRPLAKVSFTTCL